jgi:hypothetical protein
VPYGNTGQPQEGLELVSASLCPCTGKRATRGARQAAVGNPIGIVYGNPGQPQKALKLFQQALPLHRQAGNIAGEASTLTKHRSGAGETRTPR